MTTQTAAAAEKHNYIPPPSTPVFTTPDGQAVDPVYLRCICGTAWVRFSTRGTSGVLSGDGVSRGGRPWRLVGRDAPCSRLDELTNELGGGIPFDVFPPRPAQLAGELDRLQSEYPLLAERLVKQMKAEHAPEPRVDGPLELGEIRATRTVIMDLRMLGITPDVVLAWLTRHSNGQLGNGQVADISAGLSKLSLPRMLGDVVDVNAIELTDEHRRYPGFHSPVVEAAIAYQDGREGTDYAGVPPHGLVTSVWPYVYDLQKPPILISIATLVVGRSSDGGRVRRTFIWSSTHDHTKEQP